MDYRSEEAKYINQQFMRGQLANVVGDTGNWAFRHRRDDVLYARTTHGRLVRLDGNSENATFNILSRDKQCFEPVVGDVFEVNEQIRRDGPFTRYDLVPPQSRGQFVLHNIAPKVALVGTSMVVGAAISQGVNHLLHPTSVAAKTVASGSSHFAGSRITAHAKSRIFDANQSDTAHHTSDADHAHASHAHAGFHADAGAHASSHGAHVGVDSAHHVDAHGYAMRFGALRELTLDDPTNDFFSATNEWQTMVEEYPNIDQEWEAIKLYVATHTLSEMAQMGAAVVGGVAGVYVLATRGVLPGMPRVIDFANSAINTLRTSDQPTIDEEEEEL